MVFGALVFKLSVWCGAEDYVSGHSRVPDDGHSGVSGHITLSSTPYGQPGRNHLYNTLEPLTMGIVVPETC